MPKRVQDLSNLEMLPWYVVHTKARQEQTAFDNLACQGYSVYLPRIQVLKRVRGQQLLRQEPLFPRYLFLQPSSAIHSIAPVRSSVGVSSLVRFGQEPAVILDQTLDGIRAFETLRNEAPLEQISPFRPGRSIRVVDGPLTGMEGLISDVSHERVVALMHLLGKDTRVTLSHHQLLVVH
jgi:transcriptional antiterminator RfaH